MALQPIDLPISTNYVSDWDVPEGIREIVANAADAVGFDASKYAVQFDEAGVLYVENKSSKKLCPSTLVLGCSSKHDSDEHIGQFGEGYKLALSVFLREGITVEIINCDELWTVELAHSELFNAEVIRIHRTPLDHNQGKVSYRLTGVSDHHYEQFRGHLLSTHEANLPEPQIVEGIGEIYDINGPLYDGTDPGLKRLLEMMDPEQQDAYRELAGKIFVGGIYVMQVSSRNLYNLYPAAAQLNRDRNEVKNWRGVQADVFMKLDMQRDDFDIAHAGGEEVLRIIHDHGEEYATRILERILNDLGFDPDCPPSTIYYTDSRETYKALVDGGDTTTRYLNYSQRFFLRYMQHGITVMPMLSGVASSSAHEVFDTLIDINSAPEELQGKLKTLRRHLETFRRW